MHVDSKEAVATQSQANPNLTLQMQLLGASIMYFRILGTLLGLGKSDMTYVKQAIMGNRIWVGRLVKKWPKNEIFFIGGPLW